WIIDAWRTGTMRGVEAREEHARPCRRARELCTVAWPGEAPRGSDRPWLGAEVELPAAVLVPLDVWNRWIALQPLVPAWPSGRDAGVLSRALELGWRPAPGYVSPSGWTAPRSMQRPCTVDDP